MRKVENILAHLLYFDGCCGKILVGRIGFPSDTNFLYLLPKKIFVPFRAKLRFLW